MKTITFNKSRGSLFTTLAVVGGLTAFYFYRRRGGRLLPLLKKSLGEGLGAVSSLNVKEAATNAMNQVSETAAPMVKKVSSQMSSGRRKTREIATSPIDMDRMPST